MSLKGKVALVAGATRGAGRGIAVELGAVGATVFVTGRTTRESRSEYNRAETIEETADLVTAAGGRGIAVQVDHLVPEQVRPLREAGSGRARASRLRGIREGWAWAPRRWTQVTDDTGIGNPARATPEKGAAYVAAAVERIAGFIVELHGLSPDALYE